MAAPAALIAPCVVDASSARFSRFGEQQLELSPGGELLFFACAKKSNQKKAHPAAAPATRVRSADGIFGRGLSASQPSPGQSPRGACPPAGAKQCFAFSRRALPRPKTAHVPVRRPPAGGLTRQLRRCGGDPVDQERNNSNSKNNPNSNSNSNGNSNGNSCSHGGVGLGIERAVSAIVRMVAGRSLAAGRSPSAVGAHRSFVMPTGVSG